MMRLRPADMKTPPAVGDHVSRLMAATTRPPHGCDRLQRYSHTPLPPLGTRCNGSAESTATIVSPSRLPELDERN